MPSGMLFALSLIAMVLLSRSALNV